ncbi:MAG TPA: phosphatidate cytidylyltransferase [Candidatus Mcinerneyibacteriales bacterium]|nr:phosphatidate cytidylyltransferase [Candidatus Mcinerneyibacteriales bacterium]
MRLLQRSFVALIGIPLLIFVAQTPAPAVWLVFAFLVGSVSLLELLRMFRVRLLFHNILALVTLISGYYCLFLGKSLMMPLAAFSMVLAITEVILFNDDSKQDIRRFLVTLMSTLYITVFWGHFILLKKLPGQRLHWALFLFVMVWVIDSAAYFVGMTLGKRRGVLAVSPKKSVAGFLGGLLLPLALAPLFSHFSGWPMERAFLLVGVMAVAVQAGDLVVSLLKRYAGVQDSGSLLGAHGGIFDRFDSLIFSLPVYYGAVVFFL